MHVLQKFELAHLKMLNIGRHIPDPFETARISFIFRNQHHHFRSSKIDARSKPFRRYGPGMYNIGERVVKDMGEPSKNDRT